MRYVERDPITGEIIGHYANLQPGYAEEALEDDDPELVAYREEFIVRQSRLSELRRINIRLDRIEKFLNFPIEGKLEGKGGKLQNCRVRGRGTVL